MGRWMRDGSYQYDDSDISIREAMNETQGQAYDREQRIIASMNEYERKKQRQAEAERDFRIWMRETEDNIVRSKREAEQKERDRELSARKRNADWWRKRSGWARFINKVNGKSKKFEILKEQFEKATDDYEKMSIVSQMERLFPDAVKDYNSGKTR